MANESAHTGHGIEVIQRILADHRDGIEDALRRALAPDPNAECAIAVIQFKEGDARIIVGDRDVMNDLGARFLSGRATELNRLFGEELGHLFDAPVVDGIERVLFMDNATGLVSRARIFSDVRRDIRRERLSAVARQCVLPPATSAQNVEVLGMSLATFIHSLKENRWPYENDDRADMPPECRRVVDATRNIFSRLHSDVLLGPADAEGRIGTLPGVYGFLGNWKLSAFARLEVSHKLAAAFCLTDVPDSDDVHAPWKAWSLVIPDGLLGEKPARVWCVGKEPVALISRVGLVLPWSEADAGGKVAAEMIVSLVRGACLALSDPERLKTPGRWGHGTAQPKHRRTGPPPEGVRYVLAHPVSIDLREAVTEALSGKKRPGASGPKVQFLVRGHWRNQAHGPRLQLRKQMWIEPFWKGPEDARALLRPHRVDKTEGQS